MTIEGGQAIPSTSNVARSAAPTLDQVAERAGVSRSTASRAINGGLRVSPEAQASVDAAVAGLGYIPNRAARSLVTRRTNSVALVVPEPDERVLSDPFFAGTIAGPQDMSAGLDRLAGWAAALGEVGLATDAVAYGDFTTTGGAGATAKLLAEHPDINALFVASDLMAVGALSVLAGAGRLVPGDVAVVSVRLPTGERRRSGGWRSSNSPNG